jgi:hypothetical protein
LEICIAGSPYFDSDDIVQRAMSISTIKVTILSYSKTLDSELLEKVRKGYAERIKVVTITRYWIYRLKIIDLTRRWGVRYSYMDKINRHVCRASNFGTCS